MKITDYKKEELSNAMQQYYDFKIDNLDTIVFFQLGDFYELFFEDAVIVSQLLELTLTGKSAGISEKVPMAGVPLSSLNEYIKRLMQHNMKVAIVDQDDGVVEKGKLVKRVLRKIITPGTYVDELNTDNNYVGCIESGHELALAYGDVTTGEMFKTTFLNVDNLINQLMMLNIKEVIDVNNVLNAYEDVCDAYNINMINDEKYKLKNHVNEELTRACDTLLYYFDTILCGKTTHLKEFLHVEQAKYMYMSSNTQKQLELTATLKDQEYYGSLFWYLNKTSTAMGRRLLKRMIIHPLVDEKVINYRHNIVDAMTKNSILVTDITEQLSEIYDFERLISRLGDNSINPKELNQLKLSIKNIPMIKNLLSGFNGQDFLTLADELDELSEVYKIIDNTLKEDIGIQVKDGGLINVDFDSEVDRLRNIKYNSNQWLIDFELKERETSGIKNLKIKYNKIFGYFIEVTNGNLNEVPENYIRKQTMANCERYITDELKEAENTILNASDLLNRLEFELYNQLRESLKEFIPRLQTVAYKIAFIDVMVAFSKVTIENHLVRPNFVETDTIKIKDGFHPIVKKMVKNYINNDIMMSDSEQILLITGPNMAGKSTYMRQFVTIVIMAQIGCFTPSSTCDIKIFDKVFTRIGASDDLSQGKSTFMVEMSETAEALKHATKNSLIIFDELGRGTSTYDGIALAQAILEYIHTEIKAKTLFSTHYHELVSLDQSLSGIKNVHVHAKEEDGNLTFFHKVSEGGVEKSYGIAVAKLANLPNYVVHRANQVINELEMNHHQPHQNSHQQVDLFTNDSLELENLKEKIEKIKTIDINNITPIQALELLNNIKNDL
jgi:DNA mismatch repair protein MutS